MSDALEEIGTDYSSAFESVVGRLAGPDVGWLQAVRAQALARFVELDFPTTKDEDWRFTDVRRIARTEFALASEGMQNAWAEVADGMTFARLDLPRAVFVDGRYMPAWSNIDGLELEFDSLGRVLERGPERLRMSLSRFASAPEHAFDALNTAFMQDGAVIDVPDGVEVDKPVHLLFLSSSSDTPTRSHPRNVIVAGRGSRVSVVETHLGVGSGVYLTNPVTDILVGDEASVEHATVRCEAAEAYHVGTLYAEVGRAASLTTHSVTLSGALVRNNLRCHLNGDGAHARLNGLYLGCDSQIVDNHTQIDHAAPNGTSREVYKGILDDSARGVFHGRIHVHKDAQETDSKQSNSNLLLSDDARVNTKPQLEIYADQVKCTHGATIGQLDEEAIFYLRSRGISKAAAQGLLLYAYANEVVGLIEMGSLRAALERFVGEWLPQGGSSMEVVEG